MAIQIQKEYLLGDLLIEPDNHVLKRQGVPVSLTKKRFQVLVYLIESRSRLVSRQELLSKFWDGSEVYEENLTKCISEIRKALNDQKKPHKYIETVPAVGYRYVGPFSESVPQQKPSVFAAEKMRAVKIVVEEDGGLNPEFTAEKALLVNEIKDLRPQSHRWRSLLLPAILAGVIIVTVSAYVIYRSRTHGRAANTPAPIRSIAVLPLKNLTDDRANEYFSDGMTESLITALSHIDGLKVISRSSVFSFKGKEVDPHEVGQRLNVAAVLEGTVRKDADSVRVAVRLVSADDGAVMWESENYNRNLRDIFGLQDEIARHVATGLRIELNQTSEQRLTKRYTDNSQAYEFYLKGRFFLDKRSTEAVQKAVEQFQQAVTVDPNYGLAYSGLADCYAVLGADAVYPENESYQRAKVYAERAIQIDDSLAEAHASLASIYDFLWQWDNAEKEFKRSFALNSNYAAAHHIYSFHLRDIGRFNDSFREDQRAVELDPLSGALNASLAQAFIAAGDVNAAIEQCKRAIELDSDAAHSILALAYLKQGKQPEGLVELQTTAAAQGRVNPRLGRLGYGYAVLGKRNEALAIIKELEEKYRRQEALGFYIAEVYAGLGDKDLAFAWLEKDFQTHSGRLPEIRWQQPFDSLRTDPRYADLLRRVGLAPL